MFNYKISSNAKDDLRRIYAYGCVNFGDAQADRYFYGFFETFERIAKNPVHYQAVDHVREGYFRCHYYSDSIYYRINDQAVEIMAILGGQDADEWV